MADSYSNGRAWQDRLLIAALAVLLGAGSSVFTANRVEVDATVELRLLREEIVELEKSVAAQTFEFRAFKETISQRLGLNENRLDRLERRTFGLDMPNLVEPSFDEPG